MEHQYPIDVNFNPSDHVPESLHIQAESSPCTQTGCLMISMSDLLPTDYITFRLPE